MSEIGLPSGMAWKYKYISRSQVSNVIILSGVKVGDIIAYDMMSYGKEKATIPLF